MPLEKQLLMFCVLPHNDIFQIIDFILNQWYTQQCNVVMYTTDLIQNIDLIYICSVCVDTLFDEYFAKFILQYVSKENNRRLKVEILSHVVTIVQRYLAYNNIVVFAYLVCTICIQLSSRVKCH